MAFSSHEEYFAEAELQVQPLLVSVQKKVESLLPDVSRCISYSMPAFRARRVFFYFAGFKNHIGIYPPVTKDAALIEELMLYRGAKGNLSFPLSQSLPLDLIGRVAVALHKEQVQK